MDGILSQEEINALLQGVNSDNTNLEGTTTENSLSDEEKDVIGEVSNISMGTAATTLSSLLNQRVIITTPKVSYSTWEELSKEHDRPCVFIQINYKEGLSGSNILIIKETDAKYITDLMMGGDGQNTEGELTDLHLSAISEAMNQMMGTSSTSLSTFLYTTVDITPPTANLINLNDSLENLEVPTFLKERFVKVSFRMEIGEQVKTEIMQLYPFEFAKSVYEKFMNAGEEKSKSNTESTSANETPVTSGEQNNLSYEEPVNKAPASNPDENRSYSNSQDINVQPASFQSFSAIQNQVHQPENISMIMDVPLDVRVELGRTKKSIKEILDFAPGTIIELNKLSGEPVDVLVNNKLVAKGEVVVIEESFGIRITEIMNN